MNKFFKGAALGFALVGAGVAAPAQAVMGCWDGEGVEAVKLRDLQSRLMVSTLRCAAMGIRMADDYNAFVGANRATIQGANTVLKARFEAGHGPAAQTEYDRFTTAMANAYGADATGQEICGAMAGVAREAAAAAGDRATLLAIADRFGAAPQVPGGTCPVTLAAAVGN